MTDAQRNRREEAAERLGVVRMHPHDGCPVVYGDMLGYQNDADGDIDMYNTIMLIFGEDAPARYKEYIEVECEGHDGAWERMIELTQSRLDHLPDDLFALQQAWLCGLHPDGGFIVIEQRNKLARWHVRQEENAQREEDARRDPDRNRDIAALEARFSVKVIAQGKTPTDPIWGDEGGEVWAEVAVTDTTTDETLEYQCRNIFDYGYVINPEYEIAPGMRGGLQKHDKWMTYTSGGWEDVRPLTEAETLILELLHLRSPVSTDTWM